MIIHFRDAQNAKLKNMKFLYSIIRKQGPVTKRQLIRITDLKQTTCTRIISDLLKENLIIESGVARSSGGRKPVMYEIDPERFYTIGVDISRTFTKVLLLDLHLRIQDEARFHMDRESTPDKTIAFIIQTIEQFITTHQLAYSRIIGVGIGAVEPLDRGKGVILDPMNFPADHWKNVNIVEKLAAHFPVQVLMDKGANTAVLAEYEIGLNALMGDLVYMIAGAGIRLGVMTHHQLLQGAADRYEQFGNGHMVVNTNGKKCVCGSYGCVYTYASIPALRDEVVKQIECGHPSIITETVDSSADIDFAMICWAVEAGDDLCSRIVKELGYYTGIAISNIVTLLQPDRFILGGPMFNHLNLFFQQAIRTAESRLQQLYPGYQVVFSRSQFGENTAAIGAGSMVIDYYLA